MWPRTLVDLSPRRHAELPPVAADEQRVRHHSMPACFVVMCVYNDAFRSLCPGRASVESSMSSVKGFSGPASEKIKLFFIGHRRRSAFFMLTWTLAGTAAPNCVQ